MPKPARESPGGSTAPRFACLAAPKSSQSAVCFESHALPKKNHLRSLRSATCLRFSCAHELSQIPVAARQAPRSVKRQGVINTNTNTTGSWQLAAGRHHRAGSARLSIEALVGPPAAAPGVRSMFHATQASHWTSSVSAPAPCLRLVVVVVAQWPAGGVHARVHMTATGRSSRCPEATRPFKHL
jgi:hypothetical protein